MNKKAILVVSFGTSIKRAFESCIESTENAIRENFKEYEIRRAFTSYMIIKKLKREKNIIIDTPEEALKKLKDEGFNEVYVQPLHIMPGDEYDKIVSQMQNYKNDFEKFVLGRPILYRTQDYFKAVEALKTQLPKLEENHCVILMGHGSAHPANSAYALLQYILDEAKLSNVHVATVEGYPMLEQVIPKLKEKSIEEVTLMPFMLVAGDHAINDMAGLDEDSWKSRLEKCGVKVNVYLHGLGENEAFQKIYIDHILDSINGDPLLTCK